MIVCSAGRGWCRTETWAKPLADGSVDVALLNRGDRPAEVSSTAPTGSR